MRSTFIVMVHCNGRGGEMIVGDKSHIFMLEQGGTAQIAGVQLILVRNSDDGTFSLEEMESKIRKDSDVHSPYTRLISIENTHNLCGGTVLPLEWLDNFSNLAKSFNLPIHMDGARIMNASVYSSIPIKRIVRDMDSVCFCLSKSLGCPIGSLLCGTIDFISKAERVRKLLGGGMRQVGIVAAVGLVALEEMIDRLAIDHEHTYMIAKAIHSLNSKTFTVDISNVQTNILLVKVDISHVSVKEVLKRLSKVEEDDRIKVIVKGSSLQPQFIRFVLYWEVTDEDVIGAIARIKFIFEEFENQHQHLN